MNVCAPLGVLINANKMLPTTILVFFILIMVVFFCPENVCLSCLQQIVGRESKTRIFDFHIFSGETNN